MDVTSHLTVGGVIYQVLQWLPTESNTRAAICCSGDGRKFVVKVAGSRTNVVGSGAEELQEQVKHLLVMRAITTRVLYPEPIYSDQRVLVIPFYPGGSLDGWLHRGEPAAMGLLATALEQLFDISNLCWSSAICPPNAATFALEEASMRVKRLRRVLTDSVTGRSFAATHETLIADLLHFESRLSRNEGRRAVNEMAAVPLGLAAHGDFVPGNILVISPDPPQVMYIDLRGKVKWKNNLPWWDPIMDLAALIVQCWMTTALAPWESEPSPDLVELSSAAILTVCQVLPSFQAWASRDSKWYQRLQFHIALKLLGKIAFQLVYFDTDQHDRATAVCNLFARQLEELEEVFG